MKLLVTGCCGFIGSAFVRRMAQKHPDWSITNLDLLTYAGNLENLKSLDGNPRYRFVKGDICDASVVDALFAEKPDAVVNFAAETHVDRSIEDATAFARANVLGVQTLLNATRKHKIARFVQISTDEVYGSLGPNDPAFTETSPIQPNSPYAASKAGGDLLVRAAHETHRLPVVITRCSNNYGPYQFPEKLIAFFTTLLMENQPVPVYGDGQNIRDWIYVDDHSDGIERVVLQGREGEIYNLGAERELSNLQITEKLLDLLGRPKSMIRFVQDRPGHDRRYAMNASKIKTELGWSPRVDFDEGLRDTVDWYRQNRDWWQKIKSGEYLSYYERQYGSR